MNPATPPSTESPASTPLAVARTRLNQIIETTGVGVTIRVQKDHVIALLDALDASDDKREKDTADRVAAVATMFTAPHTSPDDSWMDRRISAVIAERHGNDPTADEQETQGLFDKQVFDQMHELLVAAQGSPMRALRLAVYDALQHSTSSTNDEQETLARALYAEYRERIPGTLTWENDSKADEFRAQAGRLLPHLGSVQGLPGSSVQDDPSDVRVLAALNAHGRVIHTVAGYAATVPYVDALDLADWNEQESVAPMRAALRAADEEEGRR